MFNSEAKHKFLDHKILKRLPGHLSLIITLSAFGLAACQKLSPPITAQSGGIAYTFMPSGSDVRVFELAADQPGKRISPIDVGKVVNAYALVNNKELNPVNANLCATAIVIANPRNIQPKPADSNGPASGDGVIAPEGGLTIPVKDCGNLKTNPTPLNASPAPKQAQTSVPIATLQTPETKAPINDKNIGAVFAIFCAPILGLGALFGGLALRGRKGNKAKSETLPIPAQTKAETKQPTPALLDIVFIKGVPHQVHGGGGHIRNLSTQQISPFDPKDYELERRFGLPVYTLNDERIRERKGLGPTDPRITDEQIKSIHWSDEPGKDELKGWVTLFGFLKRKK